MFIELIPEDARGPLQQLLQHLHTLFPRLTYPNADGTRMINFRVMGGIMVRSFMQMLMETQVRHVLNARGRLAMMVQEVIFQVSNLLFPPNPILPSLPPFFTPLPYLLLPLTPLFLLSFLIFSYL